MTHAETAEAFRRVERALKVARILTPGPIGLSLYDVRLWLRGKACDYDALSLRGIAPRPRRVTRQEKLDAQATTCRRTDA